MCRELASTLEAQAWAIQEFDPWLKTLTPDELVAISAYKGGQYRAINQVHRGQSNDPVDIQVAGIHTPHLDSAFTRGIISEDIRVFRHIHTNDPRISSLPILSLTARWLARMVGQQIRDKGFPSTSLRPDDSIGRHASSGGIILEIDLPVGIRGGLTELVYPRGIELELTLPRDTVFEITGVFVDSAGRLRLQLRAVSQP